MKKMSQGEMMVWAAEFVRVRASNEFCESAPRSATQAVLSLRVSQVYNREKYEGTDTDEALCQMTEVR